MDGELINIADTERRKLRTYVCLPPRAGAETASSAQALHHRQLRNLPSGLRIEIYIVEKLDRTLKDLMSSI